MNGEIIPPQNWGIVKTIYWCYGLNFVPPNDMDVLLLAPRNMILFGYRVFEDD